MKITSGDVALAVDLYNGEVATDRQGARKLAGGVRKNTEAAWRRTMDFFKKHL